MSPKSPNSSRTRSSTRCQYVFTNGTRCRTPADTESRACASHAKFLEVDMTNLTANLVEFKSAAPINDFLSRLLLLLAQNRISPRRAAVLAFISSQLLRTLSAMDRESADAEDAVNSRPTVIWDMPGPERERIGLPVPEPLVKTPTNSLSGGAS